MSNATCGGGPETVHFLVEQGCVPPLCELLGVPDTRIVKVALEGLENILKMGQLVASSEADGGGGNPMCVLLEEAGGLDQLEALQSHADDEVYQRAVSMLETYFGEEDDEDGDGAAPQVQPGGCAYEFGVGGAEAPAGGDFDFGLMGQ